MSFVRGMTACLAVFSLCGCVATTEELGVVQRDVDEMKSRVFTMNKDLQQVHNEVKEGVEKSLGGYRQSLEGLQKDMQGYQKDMATIRKGSADLQATLDNARVDMQLLTGKIDDVRLMAQKPADDIQLLKEDVSKRLAALDERMAKLEQSVAALAEQQKKAAVQQQTPEAAYQQGVDTLKGGDPAKARELFAAFLERNPKHPLAANAHYWTGESYYAEKNYEQAILEFQEVIKNYPDKDKAPAAMLKQAMAFKELGDGKSANYVYKKLVEEYPKSEEAKTAKDRLKLR